LAAPGGVPVQHRRHQPRVVGVLGLLLGQGEGQVGGVVLAGRAWQKARRRSQ
jgi:hypothetical protein